MKTLNRWMLAGVISLLFAFRIRAGNSTTDSTLVVSEEADSYVLNVPASKVVLRLPKGGFQRMSVASGGATGSPRYFAFDDKKSGVIISGWLESSKRYKGFGKLWSADKQSFIKQGLKIEEERPGKIGDWDCVFYVVSLGPGMRQQNLRACLVAEGTWVDVHLSLNAPATDQEGLEKVLSSIVVERRK